jgi:hypothetical protein
LVDVNKPSRFFIEECKCSGPFRGFFCNVHLHILDLFASPHINSNSDREDAWISHQIKSRCGLYKENRMVNQSADITTAKESTHSIRN